MGCGLVYWYCMDIMCTRSIKIIVIKVLLCKHVTNSLKIMRALYSLFGDVMSSLFSMEIWETHFLYGR